MEKAYRCVSCARMFKVMSDPAFRVREQHEVELNVSCPFCSKINSVVLAARRFVASGSSNG
jgi:DNA-directed RNA polymerase subunit RPC12/RpoP